ncbi:alpha/beta hydrolase [Kitasatospora sp. NPDC056138]|uniref:alpha/beta hydrolase n=1 Tax=Kitasatospora sp. NPDC056138 TaxID=3345724 RepID=UPI0035E01683
MVDFAALHDARPAGLGAAADAYDALGRANSAHHEAVRDGVRWIVHGGNWTGSAAEAATRALERTDGRLDGSHTAMQGMGILLRDAAEAFELAQAKLLEAVEEATRAGFPVGADGAVDCPPPGEADRHDPDYAALGAPRQARARALAVRIDGALAEADAADRQVASLLDRLAEGARSGFGINRDAAATRLDSINGLGRKLIGAGWPADDAPADQVHSWWQSLTPAEQQKLIADHPDLLGNRDGIPSAVRDQANRIVLPRLLDAYRHKPQPLSPADQQKLDGFEAIRKRLAGELPDGGGPGSDPPLLLIGLGEQGQGRAVLSWGDPDTARHVSALVPGLNSTLAGAAGGDTATALRIRQAAGSEASATASMIWLGYDAPLLDGASVLTKDRAVDGAASYDRFLSGLRSTHQGAPAHVTAVGHSYGSLLVGQAAQRPGGIAADDVVLVGSPGVGADHASQLSVGADHVYVGSAMADPVSRLPSKADAVATGLGAGVLGPVGAGAGHRVDPRGLWFGQDPAGAGFGARRFKVDDGTPTDSHDNYFGKNGKGGDSLANIGRIVGGHPDQITREAGR